VHKQIALLAAVAERQYGVFTRGQAIDSGFTPDEIEGRLASGAWGPVHRGVYRVAGAPLSFEAAALAAALACGRGAFVSHATAGRLWLFEAFVSDERHVAVTNGRRVRIPGVIVHRPQVLTKRDVTRIGVIPITTPARTIIDLAGTLPLPQLEDVVDSAIRRRLAAAPAFLRRVDELAFRGRAALHRLLVERVGRRPAGSSKQNELKRLLTAAGLPEPEAEYVVTSPTGAFVARVDLAYPDVRLAIEFDSYEWHSSGRAFVADRRRINRLREIGWPPLLVTDRAMKEHPAEVIAQVSRALGAAEAGHKTAVGAEK
jgi:hypothetical protein